MSVVAFVPDLMDRSKVAAVDASIDFVAKAEDLLERAALSRPRLVVVDLRRPGALEAVTRLAELGIDTIGFASHVDGALLEAAATAGCRNVLPRSAFFRRLGELLVRPGGSAGY
jgi:DNA-binding NarL/FixJ family response regulator